MYDPDANLVYLCGKEITLFDTSRFPRKSHMFITLLLIKEMKDNEESPCSPNVAVMLPFVKQRNFTEPTPKVFARLFLSPCQENLKYFRQIFIRIHNREPRR